MKKTLRRTLALVLTLVLAVLPTSIMHASALTVDQARELLEIHYVDPVPEEILSLPTIQEMIAALGDPYTEYLTAEEYQAFMSSMADGTTVGIGISVPANLAAGEPFVLLDVYEDGPAYRAGLLPGDVIVAVDHVDVQSMASEDIVAMIRGEEGTQVVITYLRDGARTAVTLTRATVSVPATTGTMLEDGVCYIQCTTWGEETSDHFQDILGRYNRQTRCWLIDLRGNAGGITNAATNSAKLFCGPGIMLSLRSRTDDPESPDGYVYEFYGSYSVPATQKPVVILVDGQSASASEAFTAALRDYGAAVVVGGRTFGKGVAQGLWDRDTIPTYFPDGDCLKLTFARFYSPSGNTTDSLGVLPDFLVENSQAEALATELAHTFANLEEDRNWRVAAVELQEEFLAEFAFDDVADDPFAQAINTLGAYDMVHGKEDGRFHSGDTLTRAELAQMLANALNAWIPETPAAFVDVDPDAWYSDAVSAIVALRLMEGTGEGRFSPEATLTRAELFTVLGRMSRWLNDDLDLLARRATEADWDLRILQDYATWARPSAWLLSCAVEDGYGGIVNFLWDQPDAIDPVGAATRGETAEVLYGAMKYLNILP